MPLRARSTNMDSNEVKSQLKRYGTMDEDANNDGLISNNKFGVDITAQQSLDREEGSTSVLMQFQSIMTQWQQSSETNITTKKEFDLHLRRNFQKAMQRNDKEVEKQL